MRVLVTGATGLIGRAVTARLSPAGGFDVRVALRTAQPIPATVAPVIVGHIDASTGWRVALEGVDAVVHLAARVHVMRETAGDALDQYRRVNVDGTLALARQAADAGVKRFLFVSSLKVHGEAGVFSEADGPSPNGPYAISKIEAENGLRQIARETRIEVVIIRPPLVYGPGVKANFAALARLVRFGLPLPFGAVHNKRSLVSADNLADLIAVCLVHPRAANETFLVSDGVDLSTAELAAAIAQAMGKRPRSLPVPPGLMLMAARLLGKNDAAGRVLGSLQVDITKARQLLEWTPPVSVAEGMRRAVAHD